MVRQNPEQKAQDVINKHLIQDTNDLYEFLLQE